MPQPNSREVANLAAGQITEGSWFVEFVPHLDHIQHLLSNMHRLSSLVTTCHHLSPLATTCQSIQTTLELLERISLASMT